MLIKPVLFMLANDLGLPCRGWRFLAAFGGFFSFLRGCWQLLKTQSLQLDSGWEYWNCVVKN